MRLDDLRARVAAAASLDDALAGVASGLADDVDVARVSLRVLDPGGDELVMAGVWSRAPTRIRQGLRASGLSGVLVEARRFGKPVFSRQFEARPTVLGQILREEGIRSWVVIPLFREGEVVGLLGLASADPAAFDPLDGPRWAGVGEALGGPLLELVRALGGSGA